MLHKGKLCNCFDSNDICLVMRRKRLDNFRICSLEPRRGLEILNLREMKRKKLF